MRQVCRFAAKATAAMRIDHAASASDAGFAGLQARPG
jgi:hypothetical protein